ncbi:M94 protein [Murid betaherpesvirus 1]|uniref:M94 protein n=1 Tax=Murid herpesvirus 1 TaxID=10366 RepID=H2A0Y5_MUHV1|nr:M94 protein [Murid betaherpesvirus 1]
MATSRLSVKSLRSISRFVQWECCWILVNKSARYREFRAVTSQSPGLGKVSSTDDGRCLAASMMLFRRDGNFVFCLVVNKEPVGQFGCSGMRREKMVIDGLQEPVYVMRLLAPIIPVKLGFSPYMLPPKSIGGSSGLDPSVIYQNASVVTPEEAATVTMQGSGIVTVGLSGVGSWVQIKDGGNMKLFVFALCFDVFTACCDRLAFPSLAKIYSETVYCEADKCGFCRDSGRHVDPTGRFVGCVPDSGVCLCYSPCRGTDAVVSVRSWLPYLELEDGANTHSLFVRRYDGRKGLPATISDYLGARNSEGKEIPLRTEPWQLLKIEPTLSAMIIMACPLLKKIVLEHM